ncbi:OmpA family protein [Paraglaciecola hydrolytica]|uniref:Flagellar motor protein MotB n=1 Tax=Paraglaciecola hydrolytica TaxID=1799789 RepID=A0A136A4R2_9ALTE|nr:OmpA family protein [Paraglaciecola hydrolytica]KXI30238.1 flagellar motor protein MotB [Paraglaciecola hydrolytica]
MKKISLASSILLALSMQAFADPGQEGDKWIGVFGEVYSTDKEKSGFPDYMNDATGFGAEAGFRFDPQWAARLEYSHLDINAKAPGTDLTGKRYGVDALYFLPNDMLYVFGGVKHFKTSGSDNVFSFGLGKHWSLNDNLKVLTEVAAYNDFSDGYNDIGLKIGLAYSFGSAAAPAPAPAPKVPKDSDKDGVYDDADKCANTPVGNKVDASGCDIDSDNDGVLNTIDLCPNTPAGTPVGAKGCSLALDADEDGVLDANDQCANTPITDKVDAAGCSIFMEQEVSQNLTIHFANNSSIIKKAEVTEIQEFVDFMNRYPNTDTVIEGHSSAPGSSEYNLMLSEKRANAVRALLITKFGIAADRITAVGFGETQLLDSASNEAADAKNRRITAKVSASKRVKVLKD